MAPPNWDNKYMFMWKGPMGQGVVIFAPSIDEARTTALREYPWLRTFIAVEPHRSARIEGGMPNLEVYTFGRF